MRKKLFYSPSSIKKMVENYFDYAASSPPYEEAIEKFRNLSLSHFANPSSAHDMGFRSYTELNRLKNLFSKAFGREDTYLILTSSGTEANNLVIHGHMIYDPHAHLLIAADVHPSIRFALSWYKDNSSLLPIDSEGAINLSELATIIDKRKVTMVCLSHGCNETGRLHPIDKIHELCRTKKVKLLIDGVQTAGHLDVNLKDFENFYYTFSAHKFGGPRGSGGILTDNLELESVNVGGKQEFGLRGGTENLAALGATVTAFKLSIKESKIVSPKLIEYKNTISQKLSSEIKGIQINTSKDNSLPGILSFSIPGLSASSLIADISLCGFSISSGSSCHSNRITPSQVIVSMGRTEELASGTIRISMGRYNTEDSVNNLTEELIKAIQRSRS